MGPGISSLRLAISQRHCLQLEMQLVGGLEATQAHGVQLEPGCTCELHVSIHKSFEELVAAIGAVGTVESE
jgi:hypothetical protein